MAAFELRIKASAEKELKRLRPPQLGQVVARIQALADDPRPPGCERLQGSTRFRVRQGSYRIVYEVDDSSRTVTIYKIGHRREVYR
jgi:mRNA interferase RelE/StbE